MTRQVKLRLLLDEGLPLRREFPVLNDRANVRHVHDYKLGGAADTTVYATATAEQRIVVTFNLRHYARFVSTSSPSVIGLTMQLTTKQIDRKLTALIRRLRPTDGVGRVFRISQGTRIDELFR